MTRIETYPEFLGTEADEDGVETPQNAIKRLIKLARFTELPDDSGIHSMIINPEDQNFVIESYRLPKESTDKEDQEFYKNHRHPNRWLLIMSFSSPAEASAFAIQSNRRSEFSLDQDELLTAFAVNAEGELLP